VAGEYVGGRATRMTRYVLERDGYVCCWCGGRADTAEHIVPQSLGGAIWDPGNLAAACRACNCNRGNRPRPSRVPARPSRAWGTR
jgi:5-methylcytosine-specific restriction endonuclease McrA